MRTEKNGQTMKKYDYVCLIQCEKCKCKIGYIIHNFEFLSKTNYIRSIRDADGKWLAEAVCEKCMNEDGSERDGDRKGGSA